MKQAANKTIREEVFELDFDLKAETFVSYLDDCQTSIDIRLDDFFKRRFSKDITEIKESLQKEGMLDVNLSRRSFYNIFPERFFHSTYASTSFVPTMVADYNSRVVEEEHARKFFKPLETEFFLQRVAVEKQEDHTFKSMGGPELVHFLMDLWNIDRNIPKRMAAKILKTMPFIYKIAGDLPLLKVILENIIEEQLTITHDFASLSANTSDDPWQLGVNMATAGGGKTFLPKYVFTIANIRKPEEIQEYLPGGKIESVVRFFLEHTLPVECDFEINFTVTKPKRAFVMSEAVYAGRLGISATI